MPEFSVHLDGLRNRLWQGRETEMTNTLASLASLLTTKTTLGGVRANRALSIFGVLTQGTRGSIVNNRSPFCTSSMSAMSTIGSLSTAPLTRLISAGLLVSALAACGGSTSANEASAATADPAALLLGAEDVAVAHESEVGNSIQLSGALRPSDVAVLRAQVPGTITDLRVDNGVRVQAGQRLMVIRAAGVVSQAAGAKASVAAAEAGLAVARKQLEAADALFSAGAMSAIERQSAQASFEAAQAQVAAARAQATSAEEVASHTSVVAPFTGVISNRRKQSGEPVSMGDELLTVVDSRNLELPGQVGVADAARVRAGQPVTFSLDAFPGETFTGRVVRMDPTADAGTRQVGVYVNLPNTNGRIVGGQFARGRIDLGVVKAVVVPTTAIIQGADSSASAVYVISNGKLTRRSVQTGPHDDAAGVTAIISGLSVGEQVLRTPTPSLNEGAAVKVLPADGANDSIKDGGATTAESPKADTATSKE